jgi:hypothetical protein
VQGGADNKPPRSDGTLIDDLIARVGARRLALGLLALAFVLTPPIVFVVTRSTGSDKAGTIDSAEVTAAGCTLHEFAYGLTNDEQAGRDYQRQALFESPPALSRGGWYPPQGSEPQLASIIHTLAHGWLVVKYKSSLGAAELEPLRTWARRHRSGVAVVPDGSLRSAFAAILWGHGLDCTTARPSAVGLLDKFNRVIDPELPGQ